MQPTGDGQPKQRKIWTKKKKGLVLFLSALAVGIVALVTFGMTPSSGFCSDNPNLFYVIEYYIMSAILLAVPILAGIGSFLFLHNTLKHPVLRVVLTLLIVVVVGLTLLGIYGSIFVNKCPLMF